MPASPAKKAGVLCKENSETALDCTRWAPGYLNVSTGMPGVKSFLFNTKYWVNSDIHSPFSSLAKHSPHRSAGVLPTNSYRETGDISEIPALTMGWEPPTVIDTPQTSIFWERGALDLNVFRLSLSRLISDHLYTGLDISSNSMTGQEFTYAPTVHQLFLSGYGTEGLGLDFLARDSSHMVIGSTSPEVEDLHFRPKLGMIWGNNNEIELYYDSYSSSTELNSLISDSLERVIYTEAIQVNEPSDFSSKTFGGRVTFESEPFKVNYRMFRSVFQVDEYLGGITVDDSASLSTLGFQEFAGEEIESRLELSLPLVKFNPKIRASGTVLDIEGPLYISSGPTDTSFAQKAFVNNSWQDHEAVEFSLNPTWKLYQSQIFYGVKRFSFMDDNQTHEDFYGFENHFLPGYGFDLEAGYTKFIREPTWNQKYSYNPGHVQFPNAKLKNEAIHSLHSDIHFKYSLIDLGAGFHYIDIDEPVLPRVIPTEENMLAHFSGSSLVNYSREERMLLNLQGGLALGNWRFALEHGFLLNDRIEGGDLKGGVLKKNPTLPDEVVKGTLLWQNTFVKNRLRVNLQWNWEWFSEKYVWAPSGTDSLTSLRLPSYVALDFLAQMEIKTFILFARLKNFYHDRYYMGAGSHPAGINIRWGINWKLRG